MPDPRLPVSNSPPVKHPSRDRLTAWILVAVQFALIAVVVLLPRDDDWAWGAWADWIGWGLVASGVALGLWGARHLGAGLTPLPLPNGEVQLITRGPYGLIRHPLYAAVILLVAGVALRSRSIAVIGTAVVLTAFLTAKARWEESHLRAVFPDYVSYAETTRMFLPIRRRDGAGSPGSASSDDG